MFPLALVVLAPAASLAGMYEAQQMEVGAALELRKDGHFRYQLDYGAVSEQAEGDWTSDGKTVRLTTKPRPSAPTFELIRDVAAPAGQVTIALDPPGFGEGYRIEAIATDAASGKQGLVAADDQGRVDAGGHKLSAIDPLVPVYELRGGHFVLDPNRGHRLLLRFHANDLGRAAFDGEPFVVDSKALVLKRYGEQIRFIRSAP